MTTVPYLKTIRVQKSALREVCRKYVAEKYGVAEDQVRVINGRRQGIIVRILPLDWDEGTDEILQSIANPGQYALKSAIAEILRHDG